MGTPLIELSKSPSGKEPQPATVSFDFSEAMGMVALGGRVTKLEWGDPKIEVYLDGTLKITLPKNDYKPTDLIVSEGDVKGGDWVTTVEPKEEE